MKKLIITLLSVLAVCAAAQAHTHAEYQDSSSESEVHSTKTGRNGAGLYNTGQTMVWTGTGMIASSLMLCYVGHIDYMKSYNPQSPGMNMAPIFALIGGGAGASLILAGGFIKQLGRDLGAEESGRIEYTGHEKTGFAMTVDTGMGLANAASIRVTPGRRINEHLFIGGGLGATAWIYRNSQTYSVPLYTEVRVSLKDKRVAPYMSVDIGYDLAAPSFWSSCSFGSRIHTEGGSWWFGSGVDYSDAGIFTGFKLGYQW